MVLDAIFALKSKGEGCREKECHGKKLEKLESKQKEHFIK